jgi:hypothetical protein
MDRVVYHVCGCVEESVFATTNYLTFCIDEDEI